MRLSYAQEVGGARPNAKHGSALEFRFLNWGREFGEGSSGRALVEIFD